jgi:hypothetical protein
MHLMCVQVTYLYMDLMCVQVECLESANVHTHAHSIENGGFNKQTLLHIRMAWTVALITDTFGTN